MPFSLSPWLHGYREVLDDAGKPIASLHYDPHEHAWQIQAFSARFLTAADLPDAFAGAYRHSLPDYGAVFAFLGLPLPGSAPMASDPDAALVTAAPERGRDVLARVSGEAA